MRDKIIKISMSTMLLGLPVIYYIIGRGIPDQVTGHFLGAFYIVVWAVVLLLYAWFKRKNPQNYDFFWFVLWMMSIVLWLFLIWILGFSIEVVTGNFRVSD